MVQVIFNNRTYYGTILREVKEGKLIELDSTPPGLFHNKVWFLNEDIKEIDC